ncbi:g670 [Coccomyxa elongata]
MKPTILREVMHRMLRQGLPLTAIASSLDVSRHTLWRWRSADAAHASLPGTLTGDQQRMIADWDFLSRLPDLQGRYLVMDNAVIHHSKRILPGVTRLAGDRNLSLRYLPPYCPELNPVELVFNALRTHVRQRAPRNARMFRSAKADCWNLDQFFREPVTRPDVKLRKEENKDKDFLVVKCSYKW